MRTISTHRATRIFAALASLTYLSIFVACSTPAPEPATYLLRGEPLETNGRVDMSVRVGLGRLVVAPYLLSDMGIVIELEPGEIRAARQHRWAEPLDAGLRWFLRSEIARSYEGEIGGGLGDRTDWDYTIDVYIARFHGTMSGTALLEASFVIRPSDHSEASVEYRFFRSKALLDEGYAALVEAERSLASELGASIAVALGEMPTP